METKRSGTALIVVDVQVGVVADAVERDAVVSNIATLVEQARASAIPVVWVLHEDDDLVRDTDAWQLVPELSIRDDDPVIAKNYGDSFEATDLDSVLTDLDVGHLIVTGAQTDFCITSTLHGAVARGYGATLVSDAHTTEDLTAHGAPSPEAVIAHTNLTWGMHGVDGRDTDTATTAELSFD